MNKNRLSNQWNKSETKHRTPSRGLLVSYKEMKSKTWRKESVFHKWGWEKLLLVCQKTEASPQFSGWEVVDMKLSDCPQYPYWGEKILQRGSSGGKISFLQLVEEPH